MLYLGTHPKNAHDAYYTNGKHDYTKTAPKVVISYINGEFEKYHESLANAVKYLVLIGYSSASKSGINNGADKDIIRYGRMWKTC